jgi:phosphatidylglycerophosphate synthase
MNPTIAITARTAKPAWRQLAEHVPLGLTSLRAALAPVVIALAWYRPEPLALVACLVIAFLSDIFDGVIARRLGIATPALRRLDSAVDTIFYGACIAAAWHLHREVLLAHRGGLALLFALEIVRYVVDWVRFRREAAYHLWASKAWGIALFVGFAELFASGVDGWPVTLAIVMGVVADLEGLAVSFTLRVPRTDVPTWFHARRLRREPN